MAKKKYRARAEMLEAEKAFMEEEAKKLRKKFLKEKEDLHARLVAKQLSGMAAGESDPMKDFLYEMLSELPPDIF